MYLLLLLSPFWKPLTLAGTAQHIGKNVGQQPQQPAAITLNKRHNNSYQVHIHICRGVCVSVPISMTACSYKSNPYPTPHSFWSPTKPKRNVRRAFVAHQLCLPFENCAKSNAHTTHTRTHTNTVENFPLPLTHTHTQIFTH